MFLGELIADADGGTADFECAEHIDGEQEENDAESDDDLWVLHLEAPTDGGATLAQDDKYAGERPERNQDAEGKH